MDPLKTPSSPSDEDDTFKQTDEPQGVPPVHASGGVSAGTDAAPAAGAPAVIGAPASGEGEKVAMGMSDSTPSLATEPSDSNAANADSTASNPAVTPSTAPIVAASTDMPAAPTPFTGGGEAPVPSVMGGAPGATPKKSRKKMIILGVLIAVLVVLLGGAAAAYQYVMTKPENVLKMALSNSFSKEKVKSVHFSGEVDISEDKTNQSFGATFTGASDQSGAFDLSAKMDVYVTNVTMDMRSVDGKSLFLRVGGLEGLPELLASSAGSDMAQLYAPMIASVNNQWFEINESLIKQFTGAKDTSFSDADVKKLKDLYQKHPFLAVKEKLANEKIKGVDSYHYKVTIDEAKLKSFVTAVKDAKLDSMKLTSEQVAAFNESLKDAQFEKYPLDVWISKSEKLINQVSFKFSEKGATADLRFTVDSFNKPVKVEKPEGAKSILEVLGNFYGGLGGGALDLDSSQMEALGSGISL